MSASPDSFPPAVAQALRVQPPGDVPASAAARAFNLQLTRIDKLKAQLDALDALGQSHRVELHQWVAPLQQRQRQRTRDMALWLAECLQGKALSRLQQDTATEALCRLAQTLADDGDASMAVLHDRHSRLTLAQKKQAAAEAMRARLEAVLGEPLANTDPDAPMEELLRAGMARWREVQDAAQARRRDKKNARKARQKPGAEQTQAQAQQADADTQLRTLFRQLASALHPDREPDAQERLRKTALMSEANAAYGRKDLVTLMQIQLRAELADPAAVSRLADDKLAALTLLLKQQVAELERERAARQERLAAEFDLPPGAVTNPNTLKQSLLAQVEALERDVAQLERDLDQMQEPAGLKRWLNAQHSQPKHDRSDRDPDDYC
ncbi:MAG: hypothetical protein Q8S96_06040 [Hydrogenophaga sp.]|uniref:hypothetical protein n=1 Tax=Hydrogenophaga sp. TaxID=1904254 RepID=UPI0027222BD7|nr:hypothetical protein [Hydrogenophaga sp.]MDO9480669.1 hypothetical protein [Hydrogenophaga sp.]MDP3344002.1 hypothetical protein [Hydrogenophaga sp.]MDP3807586.1 hypothetical protein [Hydrogenophaga sp.]